MNDVFFSPGPPESLAIERLSREEIAAVQSRKLSALVATAYDRVGFYKKLWDRAGVDVSRIRTRDDLKELPFTTKKDQSEDQVDRPPFGTLAADGPVGGDGYSTVLSTSGTTGRSRYYPFTYREWNNLQNLFYRHTYSIGLGKSDIAQVVLTFGLGLGNMVVDSLMRKTQCLVLPADALQYRTKAQIEMMAAFGTTYFMCTPSYALYMAEYAQKEMGVDVARDLKVRALTVGGEPGPATVPETREGIEARWGAKVYDWYGSMELGAGIGECSEQAGFHVPEDCMIVEVIDPVKGTPLPPGEVGELVFTNLHKPSCPAVRWRSGDMGIVDDEPCRCGRNTLRVAGVLARSDDMFVIRGKNVYPSAIESVVRGTPELGTEYKIVIDRDERGL
ncbi:MAG: AMP-binding protein, partial [Actinobacteria bacterium]|nr:AMP-binding protein [Actinomycetota bacterium]